MKRPRDTEKNERGTDDSEIDEDGARGYIEGFVQSRLTRGVSTA